jgi:excinuclease UvrABC nuclease subunit
MPKRSRWVKFEYTHHVSVPNSVNGPGCYVFYLDDRLVYVGSTSNFRSRMSTHARSCRHNMFVNRFETTWGPCQHFYIKWKPSRKFGDWLMYEARLIKRLQPIGNYMGIKAPKSRGTNAHV